MRVCCVGYRAWALNIYDSLSRSCDHTFLIMRSLEQFDQAALFDFKPDLVLFYGWSWRVPAEILGEYTCLMLHPSNLPKYRGGSPIQNQIIDGLKETKVTIFVMVEAIDAGPIVAQEDLDLQGSIDDIFRRIEKIGFDITVALLEYGLSLVEQNHAEATYCRRRKPCESEITISELTTLDGRALYNKIRMLTGPYPNAFIRTCDGKRLVLKSAELVD